MFVREAQTKSNASLNGFARPFLLLALLIALALLLPWKKWFGNEMPPAEPRAVAARGDLAADERNNIEVFKNVSPSVVHITTLANQQSYFTLDVQQVPQGTGTGFVWDTEGHIVTNFHVIQNADAARVTLADQTTWKARLVGAFADRDLAVLQIDAPKSVLRPIAVGSSRELLVGQKVYAIGNPFGLDQSLTTGIVSALNREIESVTRRPIKGVIQTDAAINPGNSGGPLLDSAGRLIGVNAMIYSPSGASAGIGFAIPVDEVNRIVPRLISDGRVIRPVLGVEAAPPQLSESLQLPEGVAVVGVTDGSAAAQAGIKAFMRNENGDIVAGDVITAIDDNKIKTLDDLLSALEQHKPGDTIQLQVVREKQPRKMAVLLKSAEE